MGPHQYLRMLRRRWRMLTACLLLGLGAAVLVTALTPKSYTATAEVYVSVNYYAGTQPPGINSSAEFALAQVQNYLLLAKAPAVLDSASRSNGAQIKQADITASNPPNTSFVDVSATSGIPAKAANQANAVARSLATYLPKVEARLPDGRSAVNATVVRLATPPSSPESPKTVINLLVGLFLGIAGGLALALVREQFDPTVPAPQSRRDDDSPGDGPDT